jgi:hypothetical protein
VHLAREGDRRETRAFCSKPHHAAPPYQAASGSPAAAPSRAAATLQREIASCKCFEKMRLCFGRTSDRRTKPRHRPYRNIRPSFTGSVSGLTESRSKPRHRPQPKSFRKSWLGKPTWRAQRQPPGSQNALLTTSGQLASIAGISRPKFDAPFGFPRRGRYLLPPGGAATTRSSGTAPCERGGDTRTKSGAPADVAAHVLPR